MAETLVSFTEPLLTTDGPSYLARACGKEMRDGRWQGWIEFDAIDGSETLRSQRETTQPNRTDLEYWATGLTPVYLEGSLERTLRHLTEEPVRIEAPAEPAVFDGPLPTRYAAGAQTEAVLNPYSVIRKGEEVLRSQLAALAAWHLVNIIDAYGLSELSVDELNLMPPSALVEIIVDAVRE